MIGHDLRNPLQAIVNIVSLWKQLLKPVFPSLRPEQRRDIEKLTRTAEDQVKHMDKAISDLQDCKKTMNPQLAKTNLHALLNDVIS